MILHVDMVKLYRYLVSQLYMTVVTGCGKYNISIVSGYRSCEHNSSVGGVDTSWHLDGLALDCLADDITARDMFINDIDSVKYRVIIFGNSKTDSLSMHVQYNWPVSDDYDRINELSHLSHIRDRYPALFEQEEMQILKDSRIICNCPARKDIQ